MRGGSAKTFSFVDHDRSLIKSKLMPTLVDSEEEGEDSEDIKDPLPEKLMNSVVSQETCIVSYTTKWICSTQTLSPVLV